MHRIDTSTAQVDKFGVGKNGFSGGNPQTGELPTALDELFFDSVQEEICTVIEGAGNTLNKGQRNQLITALKKLFLQSGNNLSDISNSVTALANLGGAALASPTFTGTPRAPTATTGTNTTQIATTAFVQAIITGLLKTSNNLSEIAAAGSAAQQAAQANIGVSDATTALKGLVELATAAEMATGTSANLVPPVSAVMSLFSKRTFGTSDYIRIPDVPGGLIIQWTRGNASAAGVYFAQMPTAFPNRLLYAVAGEGGANVWASNDASASAVDIANSTQSQVIAYARRLFATSIAPVNAVTLVLAIGY